MKKVIAVLTLCFFLTGCTQAEIQNVENIIKNGEPLIILAVELASHNNAQDIADAQTILNYADPAMAIASTLVSNWTVAGAAQAVAQFNQLGLPKLTSGASLQTQQELAAFMASIQTMIASAAPVQTSQLRAINGYRSLVEPGPQTKGFNPKLSKKDQKRLDAIKVRIEAARAKIQEGKAKVASHR